jgi:DNA-directed RNA polymerase specialized sigma24 family protein
LLVRICYAEAKSKPRWTSQGSVPEAQEPRAADAYASVLHRDELERAFTRLPIEHRAVVVLHRLIGLPVEEVATVLGVPLGTVKTRHSPATDGLRPPLEAHSRPAVPQRAPRQVAR